MTDARNDERRHGRVITIDGQRYELAAPTTKREAEAAEAAWAFEASTLKATRCYSPDLRLSDA